MSALRSLISRTGSKSSKPYTDLSSLFPNPFNIDIDKAPFTNGELPTYPQQLADWEQTTRHPSKKGPLSALHDKFITQPDQSSEIAVHHPSGFKAYHGLADTNFIVKENTGDSVYVNGIFFTQGVVHPLQKEEDEYTIVESQVYKGTCLTAIEADFLQALGIFQNSLASGQGGLCRIQFSKDTRTITCERAESASDPIFGRVYTSPRYSLSVEINKNTHRKLTARGLPIKVPEYRPVQPKLSNFTAQSRDGPNEFSTGDSIEI